MAEYFGKVVFQNALIVYDALHAKSEVATADRLIPYGYPPDGPDATVFYGLAIRESEKAGLRRHTHTHAMTLLRSMRCVESLKTGNHSIPSIYILNYRPTQEHFEKYRADVAQTSDRISPTKFDVIKHDLSDARVRIKQLETAFKGANEKAVLLEQAVKDLQTQYFEMLDTIRSMRGK